jgi:hypothetical protein
MASNNGRLIGAIRAASPDSRIVIPHLRGQTYPTSAAPC